MQHGDLMETCALRMCLLNNLASRYSRWGAIEAHHIVTIGSRALRTILSEGRYLRDHNRVSFKIHATQLISPIRFSLTL